jgi:hypothetical protein
VDPVGYELRTTTGGKSDGVHAKRCFDIGETVMGGVIERRVAGNDSHATQVSRDERKAAYRGLVAPYLLEIDRETAAP